jgi:hypothetical protein
MSKFKPGQSGNLLGRPKGIKNHSKANVKERIEALLSKNIPVIEREMKNATAEVRRDFFIGLAEVVYADQIQTGA